MASSSGELDPPGSRSRVGIESFFQSLDVSSITEFDSDIVGATARVQQAESPIRLRSLLFEAKAVADVFVSEEDYIAAESKEEEGR